MTALTYLSCYIVVGSIGAWILSRIQNKNLKFNLIVTITVPFLGLPFLIITEIVTRVIKPPKDDPFAFLGTKKNIDYLYAPFQDDIDFFELFKGYTCIQSFKEIIDSSHVIQKKSLIRHLSKHPSRAAIHALKQLTEDDDYEIKVYASTTIQAIQKKWTSRIQRLQEKKDKKTKSPGLLFRYAYVLIRYLSFEIGSEQVREHYFKQVKETLNTIEKLKKRIQKNQQTSLQMHWYSLTKDHPKMITLADQCIDEKRETRRLIWAACTSAFNLRDMPRFYAYIDYLKPRTISTHPTRPLLTWWSQHEN